MAGDISDFKTFRIGKLLPKISDISDFSFIAEIPSINLGNDPKIMHRVGDRIYDLMQDVVRAADFHKVDVLRVVNGADQIVVQYPDDQFDFAVRCGSKTIAITRSGSRFANFHDWYVAFMPSAQGVLTTVATILSEELERKIELQRAWYEYKFLVYDLHPENTDDLIRNTEIMKKLLKGFPDDQGVIIDSTEIFGALGRVDIDMSRWIGDPGERRRIRFSVEAPGNKRYSSLWFSFQYIGETYTDPDTNLREAFEADLLLSEYDKAYIQFLRDSAINGFMEWLLKGYRFNTTSGGLP